MKSTMKAILWQLQTNGRKNPYDQDVGDYIYQLTQEMKKK